MSNTTGWILRLALIVSFSPTARCQAGDGGVAVAVATATGQRLLVAAEASRSAQVERYRAGVAPCSSCSTQRASSTRHAVNVSKPSARTTSGASSC